MLGARRIAIAPCGAVCLSRIVCETAHDVFSFE
jgi:hypothetical protein